jgi:hypothetical protein
MIHTKLGLIGCLVFLSAGTGYFFVDTPPSAQSASVRFSGNGVVNDSGFHMDGTIRSTGELYTDEPGVFANLRVTLYLADGTPLCTRHVGALEKDGGSRDVSLSWPTIPRHVIIDSPDIWESKFGSAEYFNVTEDNMFVSAAILKSRDGFPVDATNKSETPCKE